MNPRASKSVSTLILPVLALAFNGALAQDTPAESQLRSRNAEFTWEIVQVSDSVYTAVGYSPANVSMIVGRDGIILVDTGMTPQHSDAIAAAFREISDLPLAGIIYTHGHGDHTGGAQSFIQGALPEIWARDNFGSEDRPLAAAGLTIQQQRGIRQAGFALPDNLRINNGIAPTMRPGRPDAFATAAGGDGSAFDTSPNRTFSGTRQSLTLAGISLELVAAPGETDDQLYVWFPGEEVLFAGDNYYKSFPNLYAIRGTPYRDVLAWSQSLDAMLAENAAAVVPGHTRPVIGRQNTRQALQNYRDAIRYVHDRTVQGMNLGMNPDELVDYVQLPERLVADQDLGEYYGRVAWAVRAIFTGYLGWYDGNSSNLSPLSPRAEAAKITALAGGQVALLDIARQALADGEAQWAAQLCDHLLALDDTAVDAKLLKADALTVLARDSVNALGRNYYLTVAQQLRMEVGGN